MQRFVGELPHRSKIALLANDALGNFAISTSIARAIRLHYKPVLIDYYGGERTKELEEPCCSDEHGLFNWRCSVFGKDFAETIENAISRKKAINGYDLVFNIESSQAHSSLAAVLGSDSLVCGPCLSPDGRMLWEYSLDERGDLWRDKNWVSENITKTYPFIQTGFIAEIFIRLAYIDFMPNMPWRGGIPRYEFPATKPKMKTPDVLISMGASLSNKLWDVEKWREVLIHITQSGKEVGLLGAPPKRQQEFYGSYDNEQKLVNEGLVQDLRGKLTLPEVIGAIERCELVLTLDNGIMHFSAFYDKPTIALFRKEIHRLWAPPNPNLHVITTNTDEVKDISVEDVLHTLEKIRNTFVEI